MQRYHKINSIYKRKDRKMVEGEYSQKEFELLAHNQWVFSEKVAGTNIRIHWDGEKVTFLGRNNNSQIPPHLFERLETLFKTEEVAEYVYPGCILCGEGFGERIEEPLGSQYNAEQADFILFDVIAMDGKYCDRTVVEKIAENFQIPVVPMVFKGTLDEAVTYIKGNPDSQVAENIKMEGIVGTPVGDFLTGRGERIVVKLRYDDFAELSAL